MQFSEQEFSEIVKIFESEIRDNISNINKLLLMLEKDNNDFYTVQELFREAHSIKGAARMVGFSDIQNLANSFENIMSMKKNEELEITPEIVEMLFSAIDYMEITIDEIIKTKGKYNPKEIQEIIDKLNSIEKNQPKQEESFENVIKVQAALKLEKKDDENIDDLMDGLFGEQGELEKVKKIHDRLKKIKKNAAPVAYEKLEALLDKIIAVNYQVDEELLQELQKAYTIIRDYAKGKDVGREDILLLEKRLIILQEIVGVSKPESIDDIVSKLAENASAKTLRVDISKLDRLIKQVGDLIVARVNSQEHQKDVEKISHALAELQKQWSKNKYQVGKNSTDYERMYKQLSSASEDAMYMVTELIEQVNNLQKTIQEDDTKISFIVGDLENIIKGIRMLPFATIFHMFPRMVKDIATEKGKEAELLIVGSETTADKKIIDEMKIPLIHILRNSIDHGIETPQERIEKGKHPVGKITLKVKYENNNIVIEVFDDGRGLDLLQLKRKVLEKGLLTKPELDVMTKTQVMNIIFWPGFSTRDTVSDISGRGVGLDVVHNKISQMNGNVIVKSEVGKNFSITIKIPVTMATINALIVDIGNQKFAMSSAAVTNVKKVTPSQIFVKDGRKNIIIDGRTIPVFDLATIMDMPAYEAKDSSPLTLLVVKEDGKEVCFAVENLIGEQEILRKNLAAPLMQVKNLSGLTTLSSGEICLILNPNELVNMALNAKQLSLLPKNAQELFNPSDFDVLIVEDSHTTRTLQRNILLNTGYNVDAAQNAEIAFSKVAKKHYDLLISDIELPGMSGFELFEKIASEVDGASGMKKIVVSFLDSEEVKNQLDVAGIDAFMSKSTFSQSQFLDLIKKTLGG